MKRIVLISILVIITSLTYSQKQLIGTNGGLVFSDISTYYNYKSESRTFRKGWTVNINYEIYLSSNASIISGIQYERKGFTDNVVKKSINDDDLILIHGPQLYEYISVPIGFKLSTGKKIKFFGHAGFVISYFLRGEREYSYYTKPYTVPMISLKHKVNRYDFGFFVGAGFSYQIVEKLEININGIFNHSVVSMTNSNFHSDINFTNYLFSINLGVKYFLKKE